VLGVRSSLRNSRVPHSFHLALCFVVAIAAAPPLFAHAQQPTADVQEADYVIGPEDVLDIAVWDNTQLTRTVPVRPDGKISLPLLNDVKAAGLTPMQLRQCLMTALAPYIPTATVSVIVREVHSFKVTVIGEVKTPGRYELKSQSTVLDVLAMAGGLTQYAERSRIVVLRRQESGTRQIAFAFDKLDTGSGGARNGTAAKQGVQHNFDLEPGDIVLVP
jgi:polysaccharide export outer membrane protein